MLESAGSSGPSPCRQSSTEGLFRTLKLAAVVQHPRQLGEGPCHGWVFRADHPRADIYGTVKDLFRLLEPPEINEQDAVPVKGRGQLEISVDTG